MVRRPSIFTSVVIVATFVAGPAIKKTRAAPGLTPAAINAKAIGMEPVEQT